MTDSAWYFLDGDTPVGPLRRGDLTGMVRNGRIAPQTSVRDNPDSGWSSAEAALPELFDVPAAPRLGDGDWTDTRPHPWRRYLARTSDMIVSGSIIWILIGIVSYAIWPESADRFFQSLDGPGGRILDIMLSVLLAIPVNAVLIGTTGLTLGKWIFGVRVLRDGKPIGVASAVRREFAIWFRGLGCGVPIVSMITLLTAKANLDKDKQTSWDKAQKLVVIHRPESTAASFGMLAGSVALVVLLVVIRLGAAA